LGFRDYSVVARNNPADNANNTIQLQDAIFNQIARSHVVVIPSGMHATYNKWIEKEINEAKNLQYTYSRSYPLGEATGRSQYCGRRN
jgi:hypothetical protein